MRCSISLCFSCSSVVLLFSVVAMPSSAVRGTVNFSSICRRDSMSLITCCRTYSCCLFRGSSSMRRHSSSVAIWFFTMAYSA